MAKRILKKRVTWNPDIKSDPAYPFKNRPPGPPPTGIEPDEEEPPPKPPTQRITMGGLKRKYR